ARPHPTSSFHRINDDTACEQRKNGFRKRPSGIVQVKHVHSVLPRMRVVLFRVSSVNRLKTIQQFLA
ncbi:hypothetical protein ARMSODRAFT_959266, partial [Armillaria solidipes]